MTLNKKTIVASLLVLVTGFSACTKLQEGFLSPYIQYAVNEFTIVRGRIGSSYSLITDGSSIPMQVEWTHIYNENGEIVDDLFKQTYPVDVWTAAYDPQTDKDFASITAKRETKELPPIVVNERNGTIEANPATINLPLGDYTMDLKVTNDAGEQEFKNIMKIHLVDGLPLETAPLQGSFAAGRAVAGTASVTYFYNGQNNPFVQYNIERLADGPNELELIIADKNNVPFNPQAGEVIKRPAAGINPNPPYLQNLQDYAPDTYEATAEGISIKYPLAPFPIASLGNGYNMYYHIKTDAVVIDSTTAWGTSMPGEYYQGHSDPHYLGTYEPGEFDYSIRIPMRIMVPGKYRFTVKLLNVAHR